ncbi:MAG: DUF1775 domain-containing protein [Gemmatimonadota bacterium]|nr:DUF1775 domain-containing protein [Gemmatimonadota bacterium]
MNVRTAYSGLVPISIAGAIFLGVAGSAGAQVRLLPRTAELGATESYVLQVANDHRQAITRIELRFPQSVRVTSLGERPDWPVQSMAAGTKLSAAVWTGTLSPGRYAEFGFIGVNPVKPVTLVWPVIVTYADGERAAWWTGNIAHKAPRTVVSNPAGFNGSLVIAFGVCVFALILALTALGLSLRGASPAPTTFGRDPG